MTSTMTEGMGRVLSTDAETDGFEETWGVTPIRAAPAAASWAARTAKGYDNAALVSAPATPKYSA